MDKLLTNKEVSKVLKTGLNVVYDLQNSGLLMYLTLGTRKVREKALDEFLARYDGKNINEILERVKDEKNKFDNSVVDFCNSSC